MPLYKEDARSGEKDAVQLSKLCIKVYTAALEIEFKSNNLLFAVYVVILRAKLAREKAKRVGIEMR